MKKTAGLAFLGESGHCLAVSALAHGTVITALCLTYVHGQPSIHTSTQVVMVITATESAPAPVIPEVLPPPPAPMPSPVTEPVVAEDTPNSPEPVIPVETSVPVETALASVSPAEEHVTAPPAAVSAAKAPVLTAPPLVFVPPSLIPGQNLEPEYPYAARRAGHEGVVLLRVTISEAGRVSGSSIATGCGDTSLDASALAAVQAWKFSPARRGLDPVGAQIELPIRFTLHDRLNH